MNIEHDGDHYVVTFPSLTWKEMRDIVDWLDQTELRAMTRLGMFAGMIRTGDGEAYVIDDVTVHLNSEDDVVLFKLKWAGAVGRRRQAG